MNNLKSRKGGASLRNLKRLLCLLLVLTMLPINAFASDIIVPGSGGTSPGSGGGGSGTKWSSPTNLGPGMLLHVQSSERTVTFDYTDPANVVSKGYDEVLLLLENTVASLDMGPAGGYKEPLSYILKETDAAQVRMCFDLFHYQASKNVLLP